MTLVWLFATAWPLLGGGDDTAVARRRMVEETIAAEGITDARVLEVMRSTPRHEFVPRRQRSRAYYDMALPIGHGQTISPPYLVAHMTASLDPQPEDRILEIGTGSGYQAAVLSPLVSEVYTIEILKPLARRAEATLKRLGLTNVHVRAGDGFLGWPEEAKFDKIIVTCSPERVPPTLIEQLKEGGRMVIPVGERYQQTLYLLTKNEGKLVREALAPVVFVPMTGTAEATRETRPDPKAPTLVNGSFESTNPEGTRPTGWYYQRQLALVESEAAPDGRRFVRLDNRDAGRTAQVSQALAIDGRALRAITLSGEVQGADLTPGESPRAIAAIVVTFYDEDRRSLDHHPLGDWRGTFAWRPFREEIAVPRAAREAVVRLGLFGARGQVSFDRLSLVRGDSLVR